MGRCRHHSSFDSNSILCPHYTCVASVPFKARVCVSGERPRPFGRTHEASADRLARFPWASAAALSLPVSPHMRPRCRRESPLSHGLLLFRFPSSPRPRVLSPFVVASSAKRCNRAIVAAAACCSYRTEYGSLPFPPRSLILCRARLRGRNACNVSRDSV